MFGCRGIPCHTFKLRSGVLFVIGMMYYFCDKRSAEQTSSLQMKIRQRMSMMKQSVIGKNIKKGKKRRNTEAAFNSVDMNDSDFEDVLRAFGPSPSPPRSNGENRSEHRLVIRIFFLLFTSLV